jgi:hypothetical protein
LLPSYTGQFSLSLEKHRAAQERVMERQASKGDREVERKTDTAFLVTKTKHQTFALLTVRICIKLAASGYQATLKGRLIPGQSADQAALVRIEVMST